MLTVAAPTSGTEAERAAHRLFTLWDSGLRVLGGVAAFRPYDDPSTKRRQSDVVLLVPDGVIVVRLVGSQRQHGPIVTHPSGAWSIGGEVLRIAGGGSNPLPGLRDAQAAVGTTLRASGLEPGRVAMLVAVGSGEPVEPDNGQLADGVIVCPLSDDGLAIGVRRAAALTAAADVRQWTTADVKAALSSIGAPGRVPAVEELNAEGFMYSPYVLRRPDLVAAASAVAASVAQSEATTRSPEDQSSGADQPVDTDPVKHRLTSSGPGAVPAAVQHEGSAVVNADSGPPTQATLRTGHEQGVDVGLSGILSGDPADDRPAQPPMPPASIEPHRRYPDEPAYHHEGAVNYGPDVGRGWRRHGRRAAAVLAALLLLGAMGYVGFQVLRPDPSGRDPQASEVTSVEPTQTSEPSTQQIGENTYTRALSRNGETCAGNADGEVADFFEITDCASLVRELYMTEIDGVAVLVSVARVTMPDQAIAEEFKGVVDSDGTGNVDDLLEAGERIENGPTELVPAAYSSDLDGTVLTIVVAGWLDPTVTGDEQALEQLVTEALGLEPAS